MALRFLVHTEFPFSPFRQERIFSTFEIFCGIAGNETVTLRVCVRCYYCYCYRQRAESKYWYSSRCNKNAVVCTVKKKMVETGAELIK